VNNNLFVSRFIINLSQYVLSQAEVSLLNKGLTFIPSVNHAPISTINTCTERNIRNLKLKDFFQSKPDDYNPHDFKHKFCAPGTWTPHTKQLSTETVSAIGDFSNFTNSYLCNRRNNRVDGINPLIRCYNSTKDNLTLQERAAIKKLRNNPHIIVKRADKGGSVVVMDRALYKQEGLRQLLNTRYYTEITSPTAAITSQKINSIIASMRHRGFISEKQQAFLQTTPPTTSRPFYLLPKVHKARSKWPNAHMPEGRPIVSDCSSETYNICSLIDHYLQPLAIKHRAYIKDTYHFISKIKGTEIPSTALLVTGDVTALYTNMEIDRSIETVRRVFEEYPSDNRPDEEILQLLEITLKSNEFEFAGRLFLQICGTAMGKGFAPSLANIYLRDFDKAAVNYQPHLTQLYSRFIDDIFLIWYGSVDQLKAFESYLNTVIPNITITLKYKSCAIEFLDTLVYKTHKSSNHNTSIINTRVYFKSTDTHQLLEGTSFHPKHTTTGILKSQLIRFKRISTTKQDYNDSCRILFNVLKDRGYKRSLFRKLKTSVWYSDLTVNRQTTDPATKIWPIVHYFDSVGCKLASHFRRQIKQLNCAQNKRLIIAFKKHRNLGDILTSSRFTDTEVTRTDNIKVGISRCTNTKCKACNYITESKQFCSSHNGRNFQLSTNFNCNSSNIIYLVTCRKCLRQYVGETGRALKNRITDHLSAIRLKKDTPIGLHFNQQGHSISDFSVVPIEQLKQNTDAQYLRRMKEANWQRLLQTIYPLGINNLNAISAC